MGVTVVLRRLRQALRGLPCPHTRICLHFHSTSDRCRGSVPCGIRVALEKDEGFLPCLLPRHRPLYRKP